MITTKNELIGEQTSPLFRLMWIHNYQDPTRRIFDNNICAFHIGNGLIVTVAHNLKSDRQLPHTIDENIYLAEILPHLNPAQIELFESSYPLDLGNNRRHINIINPDNVPQVAALFKLAGFDTRWVTLTNRNFCRPHLIVQFENNQFYNDPVLTAHFNADNCLQEPDLNKNTFLIEVDLITAFYKEDIAVYRIVNTHQDVINAIPHIAADFNNLEENISLYCLQSSPSSSVGRLLNKALIDGCADHHGVMPDLVGGNYLHEGFRYLIKGYFRFGSSGAPYVYFNEEEGCYKVNAIQSEACPIQLSINHSQDGNFQYVNALASPLNLIQNDLEALINTTTNN